MGERQIGALLERASAHAGAAGFDQQSIAGPNLYTNTRDAVASTAGPVSSLPEAVHSAVGSPRWANELGSRLLVMSVRGQQEGSLSLTPEHLGPLEVRISVSQDTTSIWFGAQHADTRAALTDALPRLREMFAASGLALGHAGVSHDMPRQDARRSEVQVVGSGDNPGAAEAAPVTPVGRLARSVLLDAWA
jgi:flagellar hook-length control protein FliK